MGAQLDKLSAVTDVGARGILLEFLDWIGTHPDLALGQWLRLNDKGEPRIQPRLVPCSRSADSVIYEFLEIDPAELERERRDLLDHLDNLRAIAEERK